MLKFMCIGAQKSGTTWLYRSLACHPSVYFPGGKEVHFWNARYSVDGIDWYRDLFNEESCMCGGDITPAYATLNKEMVAEIKKHYPELRVIFILRNPIERAWSSALMALERAELEIDEVSDQWFMDHFNSRGSLLRGDYTATLNTWLTSFCSSRIKIILYEDIEKKPGEVLDACYSFIGVGPFVHDEIKIAEKVFKGNGAPLRRTLYAPLVKVYKEKIIELSELLNVDLKDWFLKYQ